MNNYTKIYWLTRLDSLKGIFEACIIISAIVIAAYYIGFMIESSDYDDEEKASYKKSYGGIKGIAVFVMILASILSAFIPTKNEAILIMAGGKTMDYIQSDTSLSKVPYQTTAIISDYLDKTLKDLKADKK